MSNKQLQQTTFAQFSRWIILISFGCAVAVYISAPLLALGWIQKPFPGFMVEQTLVVNGTDGEGWSGKIAGVQYPQRVIRVGGLPVNSINDFESVIQTYSFGQEVSVFTSLPDGTERLFPSIRLISFPRRDFIQLFWLPYLIGLVYFAIGLWVYQARGQLSTGRTLAFFSLCISIACALIFDLSTTHVGTILWSIAVALIGGALINLGLHFPEETRFFQQRRYLFIIPYSISILLILMNIVTLYDQEHPWNYITWWGLNYRYAALGILLFVGKMIFHSVVSRSSLVKRQARIVLVGSCIAFTPITIWFISPVISVPLEFNGVYLLPPLLLFPFSVGLAIIRYRLLEIDNLVNRAIVYGLLTAILSGLFTALTGLSQRLFVALTGEKSDAAIVLTTLVVASLFAPVRTILFKFMDRHLKDFPDNTRQLRNLGEQIRFYIQMNEIYQVTYHLLEVAVQCLSAQNGAITLFDQRGGRYTIVHTVGEWRGDTKICVPIECEGERYGYISLGPRTNHRPYTQAEGSILLEVVSDTARVIKLNLVKSADTTTQQPVEFIVGKTHP